MKHRQVLVSLTDFELVGLEMIRKKKRRFSNRSVVIREAIHQYFESEQLTPEQIEAKLNST